MSSAGGTRWSFGGGENGGKFSLPQPARADLMLATAVGGRDDLDAVAMSVATVIAALGRPVLVCEPRTGGGRRPPGIFSTAESRGLVEIVAGRFTDLRPVSRGSVCHLSLPFDPPSLPELVDQLVAALPVSTVCVVALPAAGFRLLIDAERPEVDSALLLADLPRDRAVTALTCGEMNDRGLRCRVWKTSVKGLRARLAMSGIAPGGEVGATATRLVRGLGLVGQAR